MFSVMIQNLRNRQHMFGTTVMFLISATFTWSLFNMMWWALYMHAILLFFAIFTIWYLRPTTGVAIPDVTDFCTNCKEGKVY